MCLCLIYGWAGTQHQLKKYSEKVSILVFTCHKFSSALCWAEPSLSDNGQRFIFMEGASCLQIKTSRLNHPDTETHTLLLMLIKIDIKLKFDKKVFFFKIFISDVDIIKWNSRLSSYEGDLQETNVETIDLHQQLMSATDFM